MRDGAMLSDADIIRLRAFDRAQRAMLPRD